MTINPLMMEQLRGLGYLPDDQQEAVVSSITYFGSTCQQAVNGLCVPNVALDDPSNYQDGGWGSGPIISDNPLAPYAAGVVASLPAPYQTPSSGSQTGNASSSQKASGLCAWLGLNCPLGIPSPISPGTSMLLVLLLFGAGYLVIEASKR